jgi:hypothetical protein
VNPTDPDDIPLSYFEVECDGSACGSGPVGWHAHAEQHGQEPLGRVRVSNGVRTYLPEVRALTAAEAVVLVVESATRRMAETHRG